MTLKLRDLRSLTRLIIILVSLMRSLFSEKILIFNRCRRGLMPNLIKKFWMLSINYLSIILATNGNFFIGLVWFEFIPNWIHWLYSVLEIWTKKSLEFGSNGDGNIQGTLKLSLECNWKFHFRVKNNAKGLLLLKH